VNDAHNQQTLGPFVDGSEDEPTGPDTQQGSPDGNRDEIRTAEPVTRDVTKCEPGRRERDRGDGSERFSQPALDDTTVEELFDRGDEDEITDEEYRVNQKGV
jgi:hypothetical protein